MHELSNNQTRNSIQTSGHDMAYMASLSALELAQKWRLHFSGVVPNHLPKSILARLLAYKLQEQRLGGFSKKSVAYLKAIEADLKSGKKPETPYPLQQRLKPGCQLIREHQGIEHCITVVEGGFEWEGQVYASLSSVAKAITGTNWNGHRFFGLKSKSKAAA
jgi:hypothetical protein